MEKQIVAYNEYHLEGMNYGHTSWINLINM